MYLILFGIGAGFILLTLIFGELFEFESSMFAFLSPTIMAVTLTIMGGLGMLLTDRMGSTIVALVSAGGGLVGGGLLHLLVIAPLHRMQSTSAHCKQELVGTVATVALTIPKGGYGKIKYNVSGSFVTSPAKCESGGSIRRDAEVVILYIEDNTYFVKEWETELPLE